MFLYLKIVKLSKTLPLLLVFFLASCGGEDINIETRSARTPAPTKTLKSISKPTNSEKETPFLLSLADFREDPINIAILLPLSGPSQTTGQALLDAASIALFEAYDPRLSLRPYDTQGTPEGSQKAALSAISEGAKIILGPLFSGSIAAIKPLIQEMGIKVIGFSNNKKVAGNNVYLLSFLPEAEVKRVISFASSKGYKKIASLIPEGEYGDKIIQSISKAVDQNNGVLAGLEVYPRDSKAVFDPVKRLANYDIRRRAYLQEKSFLERLDDDLSIEALKKLENLETLGDAPFEAVMVPEGGELLRSLAPLLLFFEVNPAKVKLLGTGLWDDRSLIHEPSLTGGWYASSPQDLSQAFLKKFEEYYNYTPQRISSLAFDAMSLIANLSRNEIKAERYSKENLENSNGFTGVDGIFRFKNDGTAERGLAVIEIQPSGFKTISPAPKSFEDHISIASN